MIRSCFALTLVLISIVFSASAAERHGIFSVAKQYCFDCHDSDMQKGQLDLEQFTSKDIAANSAVWEKVVRKMNSRQMPPIGKPRPDEKTYEKTVAELSATL